MTDFGKFDKLQARRERVEEDKGQKADLRVSAAAY
jgi:hypothetical protein